MNRSNDWFRWFLMAVLAGVAVDFFLFANRGAMPPPVPAEGVVKDPILFATINQQLQTIQQSPTDLNQRLRLCMIYDANELDVLATECYEQLTELSPDHPRAWYPLGHHYTRQGDPEAAMVAMRSAVDRSGDAQLANWQLGLMQLDSGKPGDAIQTLTVAREQLGAMPAFMVTMMRAHIDNGDPAAALDIANGSNLTNSRLGPYVYHLLANAHEALGNTSQATDARVLARSDVPQMSDSWMVEVLRQRSDLSAMKSRIASAMQSQKWEQALLLLEQLRQYEVPNRDVQLMEITCLAQTGSPEQAVRRIQDMMVESPDDRQLILALAAVHIQTGDLRADPTQYEAAVEAVEPILDMDPSNLRANAIYIRGLRLLGRIDEAITACRAAWVSQPQQIGPLLVSADLIRTNDAWAGNEDLLRNLWMAQPNHPSAGSLLVLALVEDGRIDDAQQVLESLTNASLDADTLNRAREAVNAARSP
ncbi:MAG: tetratricopeptide repeat protein [Planctomycetota bacterium]|nr:tetratricopeptide repeat protein [Planctomycetota bacterium]